MIFHFRVSSCRSSQPFISRPAFLSLADDLALPLGLSCGRFSEEEEKKRKFTTGIGLDIYRLASSLIRDSLVQATGPVVSGLLESPNDYDFEGDTFLGQTTQRSRRLEIYRPRPQVVPR